MAFKKLGKEEKRRMFLSYNRRENRNFHTENALVLIKRFGTQKDKDEAKRRMANFRKSKVGISKADYDFFYNKGHIHFKKLLPR